MDIMGMQDPPPKVSRFHRRTKHHGIVGGDTGHSFFLENLAHRIHTVDGWNPANQLRLVVYPIIFWVFLHPRCCKISAINSSMDIYGMIYLH